MPALANLSLTDSQAVVRVFTPQKTVGGVSTWLNKEVGIPSGYDTLSVSHSDASASSKYSKTRVKLMLPIIDADGVVLSRCSFDMTFQCDDKSTTISRDDLRTLAINAMTSAIGYSVKDNDSFY